MKNRNKKGKAHLPLHFMINRLNHVVLLRKPHWHAHFAICFFELAGRQPDFAAVPEDLSSATFNLDNLCTGDIQPL